MSILVYLLATGLLLLGTVVLMRHSQQRWRDKNRRAYVLAFPADLPTNQVLAWIRSISGTLQPGPLRLTGAPTVVFEVIATDKGIVHRLRVPWQQADYIVSQLRSIVPGIHVTPDDNPKSLKWSKVVELGQSNPSRTLRIPEPNVFAASLLASMQALQPDEAVMMQWVVTPAVPERPPQVGKHSPSYDWRTILFGHTADRDEIHDRRDKLSEPNMLGVLRLAARSKSEPRTDHLIYRIKAALASARSPYNRFKVRIVPQSVLQERLERGSGVLTFPIQASADELSSLIAWPLGTPHVAGLPQGRTRHLPATEAIPREGRVIALSNFPGAERPLAVSPIDSCKHLHVVGPTGVGKTTLLSNLIAQDMQAGRGVILIESKGDLFEATLDRVPRERINDVVVLDVTDTQYPVGFNILQGNPAVVAADIQRLFAHLYPQDARGVRVRQGMYHAIMTLMTSKNAEQPMTFADIGPLCSPRANQVEFSDNLVRGVAHDDELSSFWQEITNMKREQRGQFFGPIMDRIWQLSSRRPIRNIIGQSASGFDVREVISGKKILLVNLGRATEGKDTSSLVGSLILNAIWSAVQSGAAKADDPTFLYIDEFQDYLNLPIEPADMFAQARSQGLAMTVAHQFLKQLDGELQNAVLANARSKIVFQTSADDARTFAREFGKSIDESDFLHLGKYEIITRIASGEGVSQPVTGITLPQSKRSGFARQVREQSRTQFARPVADVEAEINARRSKASTQPAGRTIRLGAQEWSG